MANKGEKRKTRKKGRRQYRPTLKIKGDEKKKTGGARPSNKEARPAATVNG